MYLSPQPTLVAFRKAPEMFPNKLRHILHKYYVSRDSIHKIAQTSIHLSSQAINAIRRITNIVTFWSRHNSFIRIQIQKRRQSCQSSPLVKKSIASETRWNVRSPL